MPAARIVPESERAPALNVGGFMINVLASTDDTGGNELFYQYGPEGKGPGPHFHAWDESFYVLQGELHCGVGDQETVAMPGTLIHVPGNTEHGQPRRRRPHRNLDALPQGPMRGLRSTLLHHARGSARAGPASTWAGRALRGRARNPRGHCAPVAARRHRGALQAQACGLHAGAACGRRLSLPRQTLSPLQRLRASSGDLPTAPGRGAKAGIMPVWPRLGSGDVCHTLC